MRRYKFLDKFSVYDALNQVRSAFLAAKDGSEVNEIIMGILTHDERMKIGRRVQIARMLKSGATYAQVIAELKVGKTTVGLVEKGLSEHPQAFSLIDKREEKVENEYKSRAYRETGGSKMIFKRKKYTGFTRKDVER